MKYLAFDIEIAFDFNRISTDLFPPEDGEEVLLHGDIIDEEDGDDEEVLFEAWYLAGTKEFRLIDAVVPAEKTYWAYQGNDWKRFRPLGITCAASTNSDDHLWNWWANDASVFQKQMSRTQARALVRQLQYLTNTGDTLLTWNGLSFDFNILAEESGMFDECKELALGHIDMMFHFFASKGFPLGLDAASKGMGLPGKPPGMAGAIAPKLWAEGQYHRVLDYVSRDCRNTLGVARAVDESGCLDWTSKAGRPNSWFCDKWLTVKEAMALPEPDTSWMTDPWPRSKFYEWATEE